MHLREIARSRQAGGFGRRRHSHGEFPAIGICDGIAMGHDGMKFPLASRELIADSIESVATAHGFDGLVLIPNCDKIVPGMLMAAARLNIPSVVVSGGPYAGWPPSRQGHQRSAISLRLLAVLKPAKFPLKSSKSSKQQAVPAAVPAQASSRPTA